MTAQKNNPPGRIALAARADPADPTDPQSAEQDATLDATLDAVRAAFPDDINPELEKRLSGALRDFRRDLQEHPYILKLQWRKNARGIGRWLSFDLFPFSPAARWLAAGMGAAMIALVILGVLFFGNTAPDWPQVAARFQAVPFLNAMITVKTDAVLQPQQLEVCLAQGGRARAQTGDQVIFADKGKVTSAYDVAKNVKVAPDAVTGRMLELMTLEGSISLDTVMQACYGDRLADVTLTMNKDVTDSGDIIVFDARSPRGEKSARIWALRSSRLPVHLRIADAGGARRTDAFFTYPKSQAQGFFDPAVFEKALAKAPAAAIVSTPAAAVSAPAEYPEGARGFAGMLTGKVTAKGTDQFTVEVSKVEKIWKPNTAKNPEALTGKSVIIKFDFPGYKKPIRAEEAHKLFDSMRVGDSDSFDVRHMGGDALIFLEMSEAQKKRIGIGGS